MGTMREAAEKILSGQAAPPPIARLLGFVLKVIEPGRAVFESVIVRIVATAGVIGIGTAIGAILDASNVAGWIMALVVSAVSVVLAAVLWRSRRL